MRVARSILVTMCASGAAWAWGCAALLGLDDVVYRDGPSDARSFEAAADAASESGDARDDARVCTSTSGGGPPPARTAVCRDAAPVVFCDDFDVDASAFPFPWSGMEVDGSSAECSNTDTAPAGKSPPRALRARTEGPGAATARVYKVLGGAYAALDVAFDLNVTSANLGGNDSTILAQIAASVTNGAPASISLLLQVAPGPTLSFLVEESVAGIRKDHAVATPLVPPRTNEWHHVHLVLDLAAHTVALDLDSSKLLACSTTGMPSAYQEIALFLGGQTSSKQVGDAMSAPSFDLGIDNVVVDGR